MNKVWLAGVLGTVATAGAIAAYLHFSLTPKQAYFQAEQKQYLAFAERFRDDYQMELSYLEALKTQSFQEKNTYSFSLNSPVWGGNEEGGLLSFLNQLSVQTEIAKDASHHKGSVRYDLSMKNNPLLQGEFYASDQEMAVSSPTFFSKPVVLQNRDFGTFMKRFDPSYEGTESFNAFDYFFNSTSYQLDPALKEKIQKDYALFLYQAIHEERVTETSVTFQGEKAKQLTLALSGDEMKALLKLTLEKLGRDDEALRLMAKNLAAHYRTSPSLSSTEDLGGPPNETELVRLIKESIEETIGQLNNLSFGKGLESSITLMDGAIVDRSLSLSVARIDTDYGTSLRFTNQTEGKGGVATLTLQDIDAQGRSYESPFLSLTDRYTTTREDGALQSTHAFVLDEEITSTDHPYAFTVSYKRAVNQKDVQNELALRLDSSPNAGGETLGKVIFRSDYQLSKQEAKGKASISFDVPEILTGEVKNDFHSQITDDLSFPAFTKANRFDPANASDEEWEKALFEINSRFVAFMRKNESLQEAVPYHMPFAF